MRYSLIFLLTLFFCTGCADKYSIAGSSTMPALDGHMIYLHLGTNGKHPAHICIDSCEVVHGKFNFIGFVDSIMMAELFLENRRVMPIVLENGNMQIHLSHSEQRVSGTTLNDRLYTFYQKKKRLENELWKLQQHSIRMMRKGEKANEIHEKISPKRREICEKIEQLETQFIMDNYHNVLGPALFMILANQYQYPILTKQLHNILLSAPDVFMSHPHIIRYIETINY